MANSFGKDLTTGSVPKQLITFALPIFLGNLVSTGYNIINAAWVGNLLGGNAVGAVAVVFPMVMILWALFLSVSTLTAQNIGAGKIERINEIFKWGVLLNCLVRVPLAAVLARTSLGISGIWLAIAASYAITTVLSLTYYFSGRWKSWQSVSLSGGAAIAEPLPDLVQV